MPLHPRTIAFAIAIVAAIRVHVEAATTLSTPINPDQDTVIATGVSNAFVNNNYGSAGAVSVAGASSGKKEQRAVMRFNVSTVISSFNALLGVGNWSIDSVTLQLAAQVPGGTNPLFNNPNVAGTFRIDWVPGDSWVEGTGTPATPTTTGLTWANASLGTAVSQGNQSYNGGTGLMSFTWTPTSEMMQDIMNGGEMSLELSAVTATMSGIFTSTNNGTPSNWPSLNFTASPEPSRALLIVAGMLGVMSRRRRNNPA